MSNRFYAGPVSSGMGHSWEEWVEPEAGLDAQLHRWRAAVTRPGTAGMRTAPSPDGRPQPHQLIDPLAVPR